MSKPSGLMPNRAAAEALANIDLVTSDHIGEAVRTGIVKPGDAELMRVRLHAERVDALFRVINRHRELSK